MNTMITYNVDCPDGAATMAFGQRLGRVLKGGEVIELIGDIGSGKTTFVRGLAKGIDSSDHVSSPTFTVSAVYTGRLTVHHLDLYRLAEPGLLRHELTEALSEPNSVAVIEWASTVADILPETRVKINFQTTENEGRKLVVTVPKAMDYIQC
jgi:tRNA threonylcarbamoyladenosine biosynthesis protein TsaE